MAICSHSIICPACPFASRPAFAGLGAVARACAETARAAIKSIVEADPVAACVRAIMLDRTMWTGSAADLLRLCAESARDDDISEWHRMGKKPACACRPPASRADLPSDIRHRDCLQP